MKAVANSGVSRFAIGTEASPAMIRPARNTVVRFALQAPRLLREMLHGHHLEIFAPQQIAAAEGDEVDPGTSSKNKAARFTTSTTRKNFRAAPMSASAGIFRPAGRRDVDGLT